MKLQGKREMPQITMVDQSEEGRLHAAVMERLGQSGEEMLHVTGGEAG